MCSGRKLLVTLLEVESIRTRTLLWRGSNRLTRRERTDFHQEITTRHHRRVKDAVADGTQCLRSATTITMMTGDGEVDLIVLPNNIISISIAVRPASAA